MTSFVTSLVWSNPILVLSLQPVALDPEERHARELARQLLRQRAQKPGDCRRASELVDALYASLEQQRCAVRFCAKDGRFGMRIRRGLVAGGGIRLHRLIELLLEQPDRFVMLRGRAVERFEPRGGCLELRGNRVPLFVGGVELALGRRQLRQELALLSRARFELRAQL